MAKSEFELEADAKRAFGLWMRANHPGYEVIEVRNRGFPDRCVLGPNRFVLFLEFKRERRASKTGAKLQRYYRNVIINMGFPCEVVTTKASAIDAFNRSVHS